MKQIKIGEKEYPFRISAAAAKNYFSGGLSPNDDDPMNIGLLLKLVYNGLQDARVGMSFFKKLLNPIPSEKSIGRLMELHEINTVVADIFPKQESDKEDLDESEEKKD